MFVNYSVYGAFVFAAVSPHIVLLLDIFIRATAKLPSCSLFLLKPFQDTLDPLNVFKDTLRAESEMQIMSRDLTNKYMNT